MDLSSLKYAEGSRKNKKRIGRGGAHGKTATKGHKGQRSRSGAKFRAWFEGGQMPIQRRLPKRGFFSFTKKQYQVVNVSDLNKFKGEVTLETLYEKGVVSKKSIPVKILGNGELTAKVDVSVAAFSKSAVEKIEAAGGKATVL